MGVLTMARRLFVVLGCVIAAFAASKPCWEGEAVVVDMSDGDYKKITVAGGKLTIVPHANNQTWRVETDFCQKECKALVDFNVPKKPNPPPCNLSATVWQMSRPAGKAGSKLALEFTDPTGQLDPDPTEPINEWIAVHKK